MCQIHLKGGVEDDEEEDDDDDGCVPNTFKRRSPAARGKARGRFAPGRTCPSAPPIKRFLSRYFDIFFKIFLKFQYFNILIFFDILIFAPGLACPSAPPTHQKISFKILLIFSSIFRISLEAKQKVKA